jgi:folate-dependent phosphoribosylglycinamide formyltransferase PurN
VPVKEDDDEESLLERIHVAEHETLVTAVAALCDGRVQVQEAQPPARTRVVVRRR